MKKAALFITYILVAIMCLHWLLVCKSIIAFLGFFSTFFCIIGLFSKKEKKEE